MLLRNSAKAIAVIGAAAFLSGVLACNSSDFSGLSTGSKKKNDSASGKTDTDSSTIDEGEVAADPETISGSYLTCYLESETGEHVLNCAVQSGKDDRPLAISDFERQWTFSQAGAGEITPTAKAKKPMTHGNFAIGAPELTAGVDIKLAIKKGALAKTFESTHKGLERYGGEQVRVAVRFEDHGGASDFTDAVFCMFGRFSFDGEQLKAFEDINIKPTLFKNSACRHTYMVDVDDQKQALAWHPEHSENSTSVEIASDASEPPTIVMKTGQLLDVSLQIQAGNGCAESGPHPLTDGDYAKVEIGSCSH